MKRILLTLLFSIFLCGQTFAEGNSFDDRASDAEATAQTRTDVFLTPANIPTIRDDIVPQSDWVSVKHPAYGALGDGSTDDTTAIQAAATNATQDDGWRCYGTPCSWASFGP